jgi:hypothetical protein
VRLDLVGGGAVDEDVGGGRRAGIEGEGEPALQDLERVPARSPVARSSGRGDALAAMSPAASFSATLFPTVARGGR